VYRASDEGSLERMRCALLAEGIRAIARAFEWPWDTTSWGEVLVLEEDAQRAAEIVDVVDTGSIVRDDMPESGEQP